jgi:hypothetical protein
VDECREVRRMKTETLYELEGPKGERLTLIMRLDGCKDLPILPLASAVLTRISQGPFTITVEVKR